MAASLPAPYVFGPISTWSTLILVGDLVIGAKIELLARLPSGETVSIDSLTAPGAGEQLLSIPRQPAGSVIWARQSINDAVGEGNPGQGVPVATYAGGATGVPQLLTRPYVGGRALWIEGVFPGAVVRIEQGNVIAEGSAAPLAGIANRPCGIRLHLTQHLEQTPDLEIVVSSPDGEELSRKRFDVRSPREDHPSLEARKMPPVVIGAPLFACSSGVPMSDVVDGAEVVLFVNGAERSRAVFDRPGLTFLLAESLKEGDQVEALQRMYSTEPSDLSPKHPVLAPPAPGFLDLGFACAGKTTLLVAGVDGNAAIFVRMSVMSRSGATAETEIEYPPASPAEVDTFAGRAINLPAPLLAGSTLTVWQSRCGVTSKAPWKTQEIDHRRAEPPAPVIIPPVRGCEEYVYVTDLRGEPVRVYSERAAMAAGTELEGGAISGWTIGGAVRVYPPLAPDDRLFAMYRACDDAPTWSIKTDDAIVQPGLSDREVNDLVQSFVFSADPYDPVRLVNGHERKVFVLKGPRGHWMTLNGSVAPRLLGYAYSDATGLAAFDIARSLQGDEVLTLGWTQCGVPRISKGNPTEQVWRIEPPLAPKIEAPNDGQQGLALDENFHFKVSDHGAGTPRRATSIRVTVAADDGSVTEMDSTFGAPSCEGSFRLTREATAYRLTATCQNEAGPSPASVIRFTSRVPEPVTPPPATPTVLATTNLVETKEAWAYGTIKVVTGVIALSVNGTGFPANTPGKLKAKYRVADANSAGDIVYDDDDTELATFTAKADGTFTALGQVEVQFYFGPAVVNTGVMANAKTGPQIFDSEFEANISQNDQQALIRISG